MSLVPCHQHSTQLNSKLLLDGSEGQTTSSLNLTNKAGLGLSLLTGRLTFSVAVLPVLIASAMFCLSCTITFSRDMHRIISVPHRPTLVILARLLLVVDLCSQKPCRDQEEHRPYFFLCPDHRRRSQLAHIGSE